MLELTQEESNTLNYIRRYGGTVHKAAGGVWMIEDKLVCRTSTMRALAEKGAVFCTKYHGSSPVEAVVVNQREETTMPINRELTMEEKRAMIAQLALKPEHTTDSCVDGMFTVLVGFTTNEVTERATRGHLGLLQHDLKRHIG